MHDQHRAGGAIGSLITETFVWIAPILVIAVGYVVGTMLAARHRGTQHDHAANAWNAPHRRVAMDEVVRRDPNNATALYLLGCLHLLEDNDASLASRTFGAAYHANWRLTSAAMLTFACIKSDALQADRTADRDNLRELVRSTWTEMKRPKLGGHLDERRLFALLEIPCGSDGCSAEIIAERLPGLSSSTTAVKSTG